MQALTEDPLLTTATEIRDHKVLSPCILLDRIGHGGMGVVYLGMHLNLGIEVAVKIVPPEKAACDPTFIERFRREARAAARINHQNVVRVFDVENHGDLHYLVMEYVPGEDAQQRVKRKGPRPVAEALQIVHEASLGLGAAHAEGIVHRDIKPGNLLISAKGLVKVGDLGLAKPTTANLDSLVSLAGVALGTPTFMAPEQWDGGVTTATDVWAMGATLYYLLVGRAAHRGRSAVEIMRRIATEPFPDVRAVRPDVPDAVVALIATATNRDPEQRYRDASELAKAIGSLPFEAKAIDDVQTEAGERPAVTTLPTRKWLDEVKDELRSNTVAVPVRPARAVPDLAARRFGRWIALTVVAALLTLAVGVIGGWWLWNERRGTGMRALVVLLPTIAGAVVFLPPLYLLRRRWFPTAESLQRAFASWKASRS